MSLISQQISHDKPNKLATTKSMQTRFFTIKQDFSVFIFLSSNLSSWYKNNSDHKASGEIFHQSPIASFVFSYFEAVRISMCNNFTCEKREEIFQIYLLVHRATLLV